MNGKHSRPDSSSQKLLSQAQQNWQIGEWDALVKLTAVADEWRGDAELALLTAAAYQQTGTVDDVRHWAELALEWGCSRQRLAGVLVSGVHNFLGKAAALLDRPADAADHFRLALATGSFGSESNAMAHGRAVRELVRLDLVTEATLMVTDLLQGGGAKAMALDGAHRQVLDLEMDWLRERVLQLHNQHYISVKKSRAEQLQKDQTAARRGLPLESEKKSFHGLHRLDRKLAVYLDHDNGYFVELGANDGVNQSNTLYFENERGWRGILIEPVLHNFLKCKENRNEENHFFCTACVPFDYDKPYVALTYSNLMTTPAGLESDIKEPVQHAESGKIFLAPGEEVVEILARAMTLTGVLDKSNAPKQIDLLSLDVEGAEIAVLKGLDHSSYQFKYILVETRDVDSLKKYLEPHGYVLLDKLSHHDYLFKWN